MGVEYRSPGGAPGFPFSVPAIAGLDRVDLDAPVSVLVGENGTGKSTFLEALAIAAGATPSEVDQVVERTLAGGRISAEVVAEALAQIRNDG